MPQKIATLAFLTENGQQAITGRLGDQPAIQASAPVRGQNILIYQSQPEKIVYQSFDKFADFVREKADESLLNTHKQRGLPEKDFTEIYIRFAKTILVRGTDGPGLADRYSGMDVNSCWKINRFREQIKSLYPFACFIRASRWQGQKSLS